MTWNTGYQVWLSETQSIENVNMIVTYFKRSDWSKESLCAMCGNMRHESSVNPNMYEYGYEWVDNRGYGLVQWTPRSKYWDWATSNGYDPEQPESQLARIQYEVQEDIQWIRNGHANRYGLEDKYDITFTEFRTNSKGYSVNQLVEAFMWNYEGPSYSAGSSSLDERQSFANLLMESIDFEGGTDPETPVDSTTDNDRLYALWLSGALNWK